MTHAFLSFLFLLFFIFISLMDTIKYLTKWPCFLLFPGIYTHKLAYVTFPYDLFQGVKGFESDLFYKDQY